MAQRFVGAEHAFHDPDYAEAWSSRFLPTPGRAALFDTILRTLRALDLPAPRLLELGTGPGHFAERLLAAFPDLAYEGLDFSAPMLRLAAARLRPFGDRAALLQADLLGEAWGARVRRPLGAIASTWALHDLGHEDRTFGVYRACRALLPAGGALLNGDFVKPEGTRHAYEAGRFPVQRHLELLAAAGFREARCLGRWEEELEEPTPAQNYACLLALA